MDDGGAVLNGPVRDHPLSSSVLVLNRNYAAIRVVSAKRAFTLLYKDFAEAIDAYNGEFGNFDFPGWVSLSKTRQAQQPVEHAKYVVTPRYALLVPSVIRLVTYDKVPRREVKFNRRNILARDENRCQYCGKRFSVSQLSIDHVLPKSRGGKSSWANMVAACSPCNTRKGGRTPWEAGMKLRKTPAPPKRNPLLADKVRREEYRVWRHFLGEGELAIEA